MLAINTAEIAHRFFFTRGINWVQELSIILAMVLYFLAYSLIAKEREYIRVEVFARLLGPEGRRRLSITTRLIVLVFQAMVAWFAWKTARFAALFETPVLSWPEWVFYAPVAVGCADIVVTEAIFLVWQLRRIDLPATQGHGVLG